jgi:hypothetical protein
MKISRYIKFPLIFIVLYGLYFGLFTAKPSLSLMLVGVIFGAVFGFGIQFYSDYKVRQVKPDATEKDFDVRQEQTFILFYDYDKVFDLCLESIEYLEKGKLKHADKFAGNIKAKTGVSWTSFGNAVEFKVSKLTEYTAEVEILTRPIVPTTLIDNGKGLEIIENLKDFFQRKNDEKNLGLLVEKQENSVDEMFSRQKDFVNVKN